MYNHGMKGTVHICCADCSLRLIAALSAEFHLAEADLTLLFFNPNIHPESEFHARKRAVETALSSFAGRIVYRNWEPSRYFSVMKSCGTGASFEVADRKHRCPRCFDVRLRETFRFAREKGSDFVASTLSSSTYQDQDQVRAVGEGLAVEFGIRFLVPQTIDTCLKTYGFYKQNYCGCVFSLMERMREKYLSE